MGDLTANFSVAEFLKYDNGTKTAVAPAGSLPLLRLLCQTILQPIRDTFGPMEISSGYRSPEWNAIVKGSPTSSHLWTNGAVCADIRQVIDNRTKIVEFLLTRLPFAWGECIYYGETTHLHVGIPTPKDHGQLLYMHRPKKVTVDIPWRAKPAEGISQLQALIAQHK